MPLCTCAPPGARSAKRRSGTARSSARGPGGMTEGATGRRRSAPDVYLPYLAPPLRGSRPRSERLSSACPAANARSPGAGRLRYELLSMSVKLLFLSSARTVVVLQPLRLVLGVAAGTVRLSTGSSLWLKVQPGPSRAGKLQIRAKACVVG